MISIEREVAHRDRFIFNRPFGGVDLRFGPSGTEIPKIDWKLRTICWLDYDDPLSPAILDDVRTVATRASDGSALVVTVQSHSLPVIDPDGTGEFREIQTVDEYRSVMGANRVPADLKMSDLSGWRYAFTARRIIHAEIVDALAAVNASRPPAQHREFHQFMSLEYADGVRMTTIGGVFVDRGQRSVYNSCALDELLFYRAQLDAFRIEVPKLTPREMRMLEGRLPVGDPSTIDPRPMPPKDAVSFAKLYRYLPIFASFEP
jgi:hypothetical protein